MSILRENMSVFNRLGTILIEVKRINLIFLKYLKSIKNMAKKNKGYYYN
jgi:hypothetical protein